MLLMDVFSAIKERRSVRKYSSKPIEKEKLDKVLEAARLSPSAGNQQNWKFIVVQDKEKIKKLKEAAGGQQFVEEAPVVIVAVGTEPTQLMSCGQYRYTIDLSIAVSYIILEAFELGLSTCWLGKFDEKLVKKILQIPEFARVVAITPLGYPDESPTVKPRKPIDEIVSYDKF